ncbi:Uncharacterised protein [Mycobacteroides abscessus subsp. abscessus]|nr:Uncharacterised protein [Mycobacteroides abscessus subsp. abscessus]
MGVDLGFNRLQIGEDCIGALSLHPLCHEFFCVRNIVQLRLIVAKYQIALGDRIGEAGQVERVELCFRYHAISPFITEVIESAMPRSAVSKEWSVLSMFARVFFIAS